MDSAGMTAGIDLSLAMIEHDHGTQVARSVARQLVLYHRRAGEQSQFPASGIGAEVRPDSERAGLCQVPSEESAVPGRTRGGRASQFAPVQPRVREETGQTPAKAVERLRVEAARQMFEQGRHTIETIADETGFSDRERMRRAFVRTLGKPPQAVRRSAA